MYKPIIDRINRWVEEDDIPYDFLMEVAERKKEELIGWSKFNAETFGYDYTEDEPYFCEEIFDAVNEEAYNYLDFVQSEKERKANGNFD